MGCLVYMGVIVVCNPYINVIFSFLHAKDHQETFHVYISTKFKVALCWNFLKVLCCADYELCNFP